MLPSFAKENVVVSWATTLTTKKISHQYRRKNSITLKQLLTFNHMEKWTKQKFKWNIESSIETRRVN